ncbi:MAG: molybdopterin cofactor-binding domain-containing protein [Gammaproteobacteria bacterium]|nr:molybdopterin cofactor-binding domain-containing protein [Gammaproteobacteria bacterium]
MDAGLASAGTVIEAEYWAPYLAHAPLEPMNAVIRIENGEADIWSGTQAPVGARGLVARVSGLSEEKVRVHNTWLAADSDVAAPHTHRRGDRNRDGSK